MSGRLFVFDWPLNATITEVHDITEGQCFVNIFFILLKEAEGVKS